MLLHVSYASPYVASCPGKHYNKENLPAKRGCELRGAAKCVSLARISLCRLNYWDHPRTRQPTTAADTRAKVERVLLAYLPPITLQWEHLKVHSA